MKRCIIFTGEFLLAGVVTGLLFWSGAHVLYALIILQRLG